MSDSVFVDAFTSYGWVEECIDLDDVAYVDFEKGCICLKAHDALIPQFRAWSKLASRMYIVNGLHFDRGMVQYANNDNAIRFIKLENIILMQSTGLVDKEDTEVFEGDILHHQIQTEYTFIVKYDKDKGRWYGDGLSRTYRIDLMKHFMQYYKVIGNIYENPKFLEVE